MFRWIYPTTCALCHESSDTCLCPACRESLPRVPLPICLTCGSPVPSGQSSAYSCPQCEGYSRRYDFARSAWVMAGKVPPLLHDFKYRRAGHLARAFALSLEEVWRKTPALARHDDWVLTPVPVTWARLYERGYNQAEELARALARRLSLRVELMLERLPVEGARSQTRLSVAARQRNAAASFRLLPRLRFSGAPPVRVLLVDDVYTTGATARACSRLLASLPSVKQVGVLTLARALPDSSLLRGGMATPGVELSV